MTTKAEKRRVFRALHESGCFVIPNPWDVGSALYLQNMGFKALASTSAGFAFSHGYPDNGVTREMVLAHLQELADATDVPLNADFEGGFAHAPEGVAQSVTLAVRTGIAGLSIEDSTGDPEHPLYPMDDAVARMRAARRAIDASGEDVMLVGRAEAFFVGKPDIDDVVARLRAFADAGADCLYAPGIRTREHIERVVEAVAPKPVNVLIGWPSDLTVADLEALGVRRISVGGALARAAWGGFVRAAQDIFDHGRFGAFADAAPGAELNKLFAARRPNTNA